MGWGCGGTLIFSYISWLGLFFFFFFFWGGGGGGGGFKIFKFNSLRFQKDGYFFGMKILCIFLLGHHKNEDFVYIFIGSSQNWTIFRGHFYAF